MSAPRTPPARPRAPDLDRRSAPASVPLPDFYYRRRLRPTELLPAVGAAIGVGAVTFYLVRLFLERTPIPRTPLDHSLDPSPRHRGPRVAR